jgi:hypothetical protein
MRDDKPIAPITVNHRIASLSAAYPEPRADDPWILPAFQMVACGFDCCYLLADLSRPVFAHSQREAFQPNPIRRKTTGAVIVVVGGGRVVFVPRKMRRGSGEVFSNRTVGGLSLLLPMLTEPADRQMD